jgi:thiol-disulfide isomerase/thioredoxin
VLVLAVRSGQSSEKGNVSATAFDLPRLNGNGRVRLANLTGRPTVVNFFASWCTACNAELPDFRRAADALDGSVNFVFVNSNESGDWHPMAERNGILHFTLAKDINGTAGNGLYRSVGGTGGMPITAFYDARGKLIDASYGALTGGLLGQELQQHYGVPAA